MNDEHIKHNRSAGLTIIELLISMVVGSIVLMMLMQMVVMNVTAKRKYEYENFVTEQSLLITDLVRKELNTLQPHRVDIVTTPTETTVTFTHEYDIVIDGGTGALLKSEANASSIVLIYDVAAQTIRLDGSLMHSTNVAILPGSSITVDYYEDIDPDPLTCSDVSETSDRYICGDGIVELTLVIAVIFDGGVTGDEYTFTTRIIV